MLPGTGEEMKEALLDWLVELNFLKDDEVILVEGKKDEACLRRIGVSGNIARINRGVPLLKVIGDLSRDEGCSRVIILTDWDRKGGQLASELKRLCIAHSLPFDMELRKKISILTGKWVRDVESLTSVFERYVQ